DSNRGQEVFKYVADLTGKGSVERKWHLEMHASTNWPEKDFRKVVVNYKRTPLPNYDTQGYEICYQGTSSYTDWAKVFTMYPKDLKVNYNGQLSMGPKCEDASAKQIIIKGVGEKSEEQLSVEKSTLPYYKKCQEDTKKGYEMSDYCWKVIKDNGRVDKFTFDIDYKNIPKEVKGTFYRIYTWFRHYFYNNLEIMPLEGSEQENHIKITATFDYVYPVVDIKVVRPDQTVWYRHVYVPSLLPQWTPFTVAEPLYTRWAKRVFNYHRPTCTISSKYIETFDDVLYKAPLGDCYYLAFADAQDHHVHVLYRGVKGNSKYSKAIKVLFNNDEIEIVPEGDQMTITVNGEQPMQGKSAYIHQRQGGETDFVIYKVYG
ncbi:VWD domain-containing protein, partial [Cronobacter muytjensii]|uniref:VWD domain-containing protein n=1 Tax=Cronobacter muytjensii TaxID=413501 RepID=UPI0013758B59